MYAKCGCMQDARSVFDGLGIRAVDTVLYNSLLWGYVDNADPEMALLLFETMEAMPDAATFTAVVKGCSCLAAREKAIRLEDGQLVKLVSLEKIMYVASRSSSWFRIEDRLLANSLIDAFGKCGSPDDSRVVFESLRRPDVVSWTALIQSYAQNGDGETALQIFQEMLSRSSYPLPSSLTFVVALKACAGCLAASEEIARTGSGLCKILALERGMAIHASLLLVLGSKLDRFVVSSLMDVYAKCGSFGDARRVFFSAWSRGDVDLICWTVLLRGFSGVGDPATALECFELMTRSTGCDPMAIAAALKACSGIPEEEQHAIARCRALEVGMAIHSHARDRGYDDDEAVASSLVEMYAKCGSMVESQSIFDRMPQPTVAAWTSLIQGYIDHGMPDRALELFQAMAAATALDPSPATHIAAIKACSKLAAAAINRSQRSAALEKTMAVHAQAAATHSDLAGRAMLSNTLVDAYAKCGSIEDARRVFFAMRRQDTVSWNSIIAGAGIAGRPRDALRFFEAMLQQDEGIRWFEPDAWTFAAALKSLVSLAEEEEELDLEHEEHEERSKLGVKIVSLERCMAIHSQLIHLSSSRLQCDDHRHKHRLLDAVVKNSLLDAYSKCGSIADALRVFQSMDHPNEVSWNSLLWSCATSGRAKLALELFQQRHEEEQGEIPSARSCAAALAACSTVGDLLAAKSIHSRLCRRSPLDSQDDTNLLTCLIDCYAKCGSVADAQLVFDSSTIAGIDSTGWNALISGYGRAGGVDAALRLFDELEFRRWPKPSSVTFLILLTACSHTGRINKARDCFRAMVDRHAAIEHYHCLINMFGRVNQIDAAVEVVEGMPFEGNEVTRTLVLDACSKL